MMQKGYQFLTRICTCITENSRLQQSQSVTIPKCTINITVKIFVSLLLMLRCFSSAIGSLINKVMVRSGVHSAISNMVSRLELFAAVVKWIRTGRTEAIGEGRRAK